MHQQPEPSLTIGKSYHRRGSLRRGSLGRVSLGKGSLGKGSLGKGSLRKGKLKRGSLGKISFHKQRKSLDSLIDFDDDGSDFSDDNHYLEVPRNKTGTPIGQRMNNVADIAARVFIRPWPNRHIDNNEELVSKEESEYRLLLIYIFLTIIIGLVATSIVIVCPFYCINPEYIFFNHSVNQTQGTTTLLFLFIV